MLIIQWRSIEAVISEPGPFIWRVSRTAMTQIHSVSAVPTARSAAATTSACPEAQMWPVSVGVLDLPISLVRLLPGLHCGRAWRDRNLAGTSEELVAAIGH